MSILQLQNVKSGGGLARNGRFGAPTCLVSRLWFSRGLAVSMGEAAKLVLLSCCQLWKSPEVSYEMIVLMLPRVSSRVSGFPAGSPCLWGKLQNLSFSKVSKEVVMSFCVAGVALCDIPTCLIMCQKCQNCRKSRMKCWFFCIHVSCLESLVCLWRRRVYGGSWKTPLFRRFPSRLSCRFAWQAWHFVTFQAVWQRAESVSGFLDTSPCLWGKLQNISFSKVSKQVVMSFCVAGVALFDIPTLHSTLYTLHSTLYTPHSTLYTPLYTLHTPHSTLYTLHFKLYTLHSKLYILNSTLYTLHSSLDTPHSTLYTPHSTLHTLHSTLYSLHSTLHTLHFTLHTLHFTVYTLHSTLHSPHSTRYTLYTPHSTLYTPHPLLYTSHSTLHTLHFSLHTPHFTFCTPHSTLCTPHSTLSTLHHFTLCTLHFKLYTLHSTLYTLHATLHT